jgi:hypothetical protein
MLEQEKYIINHKNQVYQLIVKCVQLQMKVFVKKKKIDHKVNNNQE